MESSNFLLPSPNFDKNAKAEAKTQPHYLTPSGMTLLTRDKQPPPMYGPRGTTIPPKFLREQQYQNRKHAQGPPISEPAPVPEHCEACDMEFQSEQDLRRHRAQHEPCPVEECHFRGHPSVMDKHVVQLHSSGLFEEVRRLSTPEEINAWRDERRKRFPTVAKTKLLQLAREQREKRGERLRANQSRFGRPEDIRRITNTAPNATGTTYKDSEQHEANNEQCNHRRNKRGKHDRQPPKKQDQPCEPKTIPAVPPKRPKVETKPVKEVSEIIKFKGTSRMQDYKHFKKPKSVVANPLAKLLSVYGSDSDETDSDEGGKIDEGTEQSTNIKEVICDMHEKDQEKVADASAKSKTKAKRSPRNPFKEDPEFAFPPGPDSASSSEGEMPQKTQIVYTNGHSETTIAKVDDFKSSGPSDIEVQNKEAIAHECQAPQQADAQNKSAKKNDTNHSAPSDNEAPDEKPISHGGETSVKALKSQEEASLEDQSKNDASSDDEAPDEAPIFHNSSDVAAPSIEPQQPDISLKEKAKQRLREQLLRKRKSGLNYRKARLRKQNTMLEKLLEPEILHERNMLLQCVRFVCENNFFGIGGKKVTPVAGQEGKEKVEEKQS